MLAAGIILASYIDYPYYFFDHAGSADGGATASAGGGTGAGRDTVGDDPIAVAAQWRGRELWAHHP